MPTEVILSEVPIGIVTKACRGGETVSVRMSGFVSSEDGQELITFLEGLPSLLLAKATGNQISPSQVDNLLAIIRSDKTAVVYVNEVYPKLLTKVGRAKGRGDPVFKDDIIDITRAELGVAVPDDAAVVYVFSWGWRQGVFYDFGPTAPEARRRPFDLPGVLGELYAQLMFQERFRIAEDEWARLFGSGWFPFVGLGNELLSVMLAHLREGGDLDELTPRIAEDIRGKVPSFLQAWLLHPAFAPHATILEKAVSHFLSGDYVSCAGLLYPQIEAILRLQPVAVHAGRPGSLLMPHRFEEYLKEVYLPQFSVITPVEGQMPSVVSPQKSAAIAILVVHQLFHSFDPPPTEHTAVGVGSSGEASRRRPEVDAAGAANRWSQWTARAEDEVLERLIAHLDANLPSGVKRLQGEALDPLQSGVRPGAVWYSIDATPEHVGLTLSLERTRPDVMRGGRVLFAAPPHPPTATIPAAWGQVMTFLDEGIVVAARAVGAQVAAPGVDELFLDELPPDVAGMLIRFSRSARKALPLAADDAQLWHSFVIGAYRARAAVESRRLAAWFVHEGWERTAALDLTMRFFEQCRLLGRYAEEVALVS